MKERNNNSLVTYYSRFRGHIIYLYYKGEYVCVYIALSNFRQKIFLRFSFFYAQSDGSQFSWKWNFLKIPKVCFYSYNVYLRKVSAFRHNLGCVPRIQNWVFFQIYEIQHIFLLYYSARKKATSMVFI